MAINGNPPANQTLLVHHVKYFASHSHSSLQFSFLVCSLTIQFHSRAGGSGRTLSNTEWPSVPPCRSLIPALPYSRLNRSTHSWSRLWLGFTSVQAERDPRCCSERLPSHCPSLHPGLCPTGAFPAFPTHLAFLHLKENCFQKESHTQLSHTIYTTSSLFKAVPHRRS